MECISKNTEETAQVAKSFAESLREKDRPIIVGLYGELGAGKTTFMKYFAKALGVEEEIQSPTFVIMKRYKTSGPRGEMNLIHVDAYRLEIGGELLGLGWQEIIKNNNNIVCVEWPENVAEIMPPHLMVRLEHLKDSNDQSQTHRKISIA